MNKISLVAQPVKILPAVQETRFKPWEDPLEKGMTIPSSILTWRILWTEEFGGLQSMVLQRDRHNWVTKHLETLCWFKISLSDHVEVSPCVWFLGSLQQVSNPVRECGTNQQFPAKPFMSMSLKCKTNEFFKWVVFQLPCIKLKVHTTIFKIDNQQGPTL